MHLWTEYEGRTIAGAYTLGKLLRSEGRNGFFATSDTTGNSAVIRLTEAHYDEDEQLKRWRRVAGMHQDNLIEIERVGQTNFDGVPLTYALMESNDANLGDVLTERPLTVTEATEVAKSVLAALSALHASGLVHEHIEPSNILAVGDVVKLRSDCVRECVADSEFNTPEGCAELRRRDIHDFGILMLQCLTLEKQFTPAQNLPEPFKRIIPRALDGSWTLEQITRVLDPEGSAPRPIASQATASPAVPPHGQSAAKPAAAPAASQASGSKPAAAAAAASPRSSTPQPATPVAAASAGTAQGKLPLAIPQPDAQPDLKSDPIVAVRSHRAPVEEPSRLSMRTIWGICAASAIVLLILAWHFFSAKPATPAPIAASPATSAPAQTLAPVVRSAPAAQPIPAATLPAAAPRAETPAPAAHGAGWYVIAYTYNHQGQAQAKADRLNGRRSGLHAQVFSPHGGAPFLVSLGGPLSRNEAESVLRRARRSGMPRDTFVRNFR
ncbi:MAG TPA: hypothetical protein VM865_09635 [Acidobacteriaceae bacterium]|jgi:hypothetical protein|nr:hypothetical protein [Acidobacteriaceae bacterium]